MTINKKIKTLGLGAALFSVATASAFAHDTVDNGGSLETPHAVTNADECGAGTDVGLDVGPNVDQQTTDDGYPDPGSAYGSYAADCMAVSDSDSADIDATAHVLASLKIDCVANVTADVIAATNPHTGSDFAVADECVDSFSFPTQTSAAGGQAVTSDTFRVEVDSNSDWQLYAQVSAPFENTDPDNTSVKALSTFGVEGEDQDGAGVAFATLGTDILIDNDGDGAGPDDDDDSIDTEDGIDFTIDSSVGFTFTSANDPAIEAGDYAGVITLTVTAV